MKHEVPSSQSSVLSTVSSGTVYAVTMVALACCLLILVLYLVYYKREIGYPLFL